MKLKLSVLIMSICWTNLQAQEGNIVEVMSYNILHGATLNNDFDLDKIARVITDKSPDLVGLQEVDFFTNRAKGMDLATELGYRTKMAGLFGEAMPFFMNRSPPGSIFQSVQPQLR